MGNSLYQNNSELLQKLMQQVSILHLSELSDISGVSQWQLRRLQHGLIQKMDIETVLKISEALQIPINKLLSIFLPESIVPRMLKEEDLQEETLTYLKQEYQRLQQQMEQQREILQQEFQQSSLQVLESWMIYWPTAANIAKENPNLSAVKLLSLVKPVEKLLENWGIETIASVGEELPFSLQWHQLIEGEAEPGDKVIVRNVGYRQGDKLLYRAKVSPVN